MVENNYPGAADLHSLLISFYIINHNYTRLTHCCAEDWILLIYIHSLSIRIITLPVLTQTNWNSRGGNYLFWLSFNFLNNLWGKVSKKIQKQINEILQFLHTHPLPKCKISLTFFWNLPLAHCYDLILKKNIFLD